VSANPGNTDMTNLASSARLTPWQLICYGALSMPVAMGGLALVTFIPTYYAVDLGLGLGLVGMIFVFGRLLDVITDPLIGYFSDETRTKIGPRRPWMIIGTPLFCVAAWMLFVPPDNVSLLYLIIASGAYFLFYTVLDVPYSSVGLEISPHIHERSILASSKAIFQVIGAITAAFLPFLLAATTAISLALTAKLIAVFSVIGLILFLVFVPHRNRTVISPCLKFHNALKLTWTSHPYRYLIIAFVIVQTANSLTAGLTVLFVSNVIGTPDLVGLFLGLLLLSSAIFLPIWVWISKRWNKKRAWLTSIMICILMLMATPILGEGDVIPVAIFCIIIGGAFGCDAIMPTSMLADIVYENEKKGQNRLSALYLAIKNSASKLTFIAPMGLAFPVLGMLGFNSGSEMNPQKHFMLIFFYALLPIILRFIALIIIQKMPKTETLGITT